MSGGCFPVVDQAGAVVSFERWGSRPPELGPGRDFRWARIKAVDRAVEKAVRSYGQVIIMIKARPAPQGPIHAHQAPFDYGSRAECVGVRRLPAR